MKGKKKPYDKREARFNPVYNARMSKNMKNNEIAQVGKIQAEVREINKRILRWF